ncbi:MAG TPA: 16S rRNA (guanine(527)-N(7))-methyltransferase RsmG [Methylomirabilota bacterium]|nr:16S rRNA (guanine(527)-N(7))-methyltransferase RsmG [Methylomirabilota bacterium]
MNDTLAYLERRAGVALQRAVSPPEIATLHKYMNLLIKWQKSQRLVGSSAPTWIVDHVIVDSLLFARVIPLECRTLCDVGSGSGIPGIPLAAVMPDVDVTLLEARQKRGSFLATVIRELALTNCHLVNRRLEQAGPELLQRFDVAVMRCAGSPTALWPQVRRLVRADGVVIASGPPERRDVEFGDWLEVEGPDGPRRFWVHRTT